MHADHQKKAAAGGASGVRMRARARFSQVICECIKKFRTGAGKGLRFSDGGPQFWGPLGNLQKGNGQL